MVENFDWRVVGSKTKQKIEMLLATNDENGKKKRMKLQHQPRAARKAREAGHCVASRGRRLKWALDYTEMHSKVANEAMQSNGNNSACHPATLPHTHLQHTAPRGKAVPKSSTNYI